MAANPDASDVSSFVEQLERRSRDLSLRLPLILGISSSSTTREPSSDSDQESEERRMDRIILINPITQGMIVIEGGRSLESLLRDALTKEGLPPASKASIEEMPTVEITLEDLDKECSICLDGWEIGGEAKEMPCKHRHHAGCIEKWLRMHGSCPVCRFEMPNDEEECRKRGRGDHDGDSEDDEGRERRADRGEIWVTFSFSNSSDGDRDSTTTTTTTATESSSDSSPNTSNDDGTSNNSNP
ncbi:E3 ubiquitin-protein ligase MPSR1-like [Telopea speciosissima]|uniref:E3 ubiquitin-protein ligase MPSR1-like n=1 Tax=Telopea speciosissima TaxID=54955 RepID=UPI001CC3BFFE|nr:E3 ubiquitin-protein ligase MPSR1-like [Telopea speciosissima]